MSVYTYVLIFIGGVLASFFLTDIVKKLAERWNFVDDPKKAPERKKQTKPIPLLGGIAIYIAFVGIILWLLPEITQGYLLAKHVIGICLAGGLLMVGGSLDDKYSLSPGIQIFFPICAAIIIVASGIGIDSVTNPLGGVIPLNQWQITLFTWNDLPYQFTLLADLFTLVWLLGAMYTTKILDGLDGLVPGITMIGGITIFFLSISQEVGQPETGVLALVLAATALGFLFWNFSPAKIYLGEGGALFAGFMLGVLAILSGGKIATALLILGLPIIDVAWVIIRRRWIEKRSIFSGDTLHLHYQLKKLGLKDRTIVLLFYLITMLFGFSTLLVSGISKLFVLLGLIILSTGLLITLYRKVKTII
ncbi:MAG: MraY family glycosyltransferase [bacterium]|nr:MraY family glycosyltransferase [bacterium]